MTNLIDDGAAWLVDRLKESAGRTSVYIRGGKRTTITAVRVAQDETAQDANGIPITIRDHELMIAVADLTHEPRAGDIIEETVRGATVRWEVVPRGGGPAWEWWDQANAAYRVFVQEV